MGHVGLPVAEQHGDDVGDPVVDVVLGEVQAVAHGQQMAQRDGVRGSPGADHSGTSAGASRSSRPSLDQEADHGVQHRLGHRPTQQACLDGDRLGRAVEVRQPALVPLGHEPAAVDDDDGVGGGQRARVVADLVQQRVEGDLGRDAGARPLGRGPRDAAGLRGADGIRLIRPGGRGARRW